MLRTMRTKLIPALVLAVPFGGCVQPRVEQFDPYATSVKATVDLPTSIQAGPYRMVFKERTSVLTYREYDPEPTFAMISFDAPFTLERPVGPPVPIELRLEKTDLGTQVGGGYSEKPLDPFPSERANTLGYENGAPVDWRGDRLALQGAIHEVRNRSYTAVFRNLFIQSVPRQETRRADYNIGSNVPQTVELDDGVTVTFEAQSQATSRLPLTIRYDPERLLSGVLPEDVELKDLKSNLGLFSGYTQNVPKSGRFHIECWLDRTDSQEKDAKTLRVTFTLQQILRRYPFRTSVSIAWQRETPPSKRPKLRP